MSSSQFRRFAFLLLMLALGAWLIRRPASLGPETTERQQALRQALAVNGVPDGLAAGASTEQLGPITPVTVHMDAIPENTSDEPSQYELWLRGEIDLENEYRGTPAEVAALQADALDQPVNPSVQQAVTGSGPSLVLSFDSVDYSDGSNPVPPDPEMAAGPNHLITAVNYQLAIYSKTGTLLYGPVHSNSFFSGNPNCTGTFDPNAVYDEAADRFIIGIDAAGDYYCAAVSVTNDPLGSWYIYAVPADILGAFHDYPHTGVGRDAIYVGGNQFVDGSFLEGRIWALNKSKMYSGAAMTPVTFSTGVDGGTPQPLHLHGYAQGTWPSSGPHYFITDRYDGATVDIWAWPDALGGGTPTIVATLNLGAGGFPVNVPQMGGSNIRANDWRERGFEYRNGYGWVTDSISCNPGGGTVNCVRWAQIDLTGPTPALAQTGVFASSGQHRIFPDLAVNHCNDMVIGYTKSSTAMYPGIWFTGRESGDPAGTLLPEAQLNAGETPYVAYDSVPRRWGDYTGMTIDPDGVTFWYLGEYSKNITAAAKWGTYVGAFTFPTCSAATEPDVTVQPGSLVQAQLPDIQATQALTVGNAGTASLTWTVTEAPAGGPTPCAAPADLPWVSAAQTNGSTLPGADSVVDVTFDSTGLVENVYDGVLCLASDDPDEPLVEVPLTLTVEPFTYAVALTGNQASDGLPGADVAYTVAVTNNGNTTDTFDLAAAGAWAVAVSESEVTLGAGASASFTVTVTVPANALAGASNATTIMAASQSNASATDGTTLTTTALAVYDLDLAADLAERGIPGRFVTYVLTLTNLGNGTDTFSIGVSSAWASDVPVASFELDPGESAQVTVSLAVPAGATPGDVDVTTVQAMSTGMGSVTDDVTLTTTVYMPTLYLPVVVSP